MGNTGTQLKTIREQRHMTQAHLAEIVGVDRSHIAKIENNDTNGSISVLKKIAVALGVPLAELLDESPPKAVGE